MSKITIRPKWEWETHPCPECGQVALKYDGSVKWGNGPRPGRKLATTGPVGFSPRADFEIAHYFHCEECGIEFYDPVDSRRPQLFKERRAAKPKEKEIAPTTDAPTQTTVTAFTPGSVGAVSEKVGYDARDLVMMGFTHQEISSFSKEEIMSVVNGKRALQELRNEKKPPAKKLPSHPPTLSEKQIKELVWGLWADKDPNEADFRDAMRFAGKYRKECERKLRELGKDAIPYLEPYASRKEVALLLEELKKL